MVAGHRWLHKGDSYRRDPNEKYVNVNYTDDQEDQDIKEQDVVRPQNHRWVSLDSKETATWHLKSRAKAPTYGVCASCFNSGPTGKDCNECSIRNIRDRRGFKVKYVIMRYQEGYPTKILDSITFAAMLGRQHETAKADRLFRHQLMTKTEGMSESRFSAIARCKSKTKSTNEQEEEEVKEIMQDQFKLSCIVREHVKMKNSIKLEKEVTGELERYREMLKPDNEYNGPLV